MNFVELIIIWLKSNWLDCTCAVLFIGLLLLLYKIGKKKQVKKIVYELVEKAEDKFGGGTGELKYAKVVEWLYYRLPRLIRFLFSMKDIDKMIEWAVAELKNKLADKESPKLE